MGHSYYFEGEIEITPPLNFTEIQKAQKAALKVLTNTWDKKNAKEDNVFASFMPLKLDLESFVRNTDEGPLHVTRAAKLVPSNSSDGGYAYLMCNLVEVLIRELPGHNWEGAVMAVDDDRRSAVKITVVTGQDTSTVSEVQGSTWIHWEDGDNTPLTDVTS
jgi:hypothetical protein